MIDSFFELQLKGAAVMAVSTIIYYLFFSGDRSFHRNRVWLLSSLIIPWIVPVLAMPLWVKELLFAPEVNVNELVIPIDRVVTNPHVITETEESLISWQLIVVLCYALVSLVLLLRLMWGYLFLFRLMRHGKISKYKGIRVVHMADQAANSFSFFKTIFIPDNLEKKTDQRLVLEHEKIHCDQWHSVDRSLVEWVLIFHWWNPFVWWLRKLIAQNHEYCVDSAIIRQTKNPKVYQYSLIHLMPVKQSLRLVNNFNQNLTKKRIIMMNKEHTNRFLNHFKVISMVALMPLLLLAFTNPAKTQHKVEMNVASKDNPKLEITQDNGEQVIISRKGDHLSVKGKKSAMPDFYIDHKSASLQDVEKIKVENLSFFYAVSGEEIQKMKEEKHGLAKKTNLKSCPNGALMIITEATQQYKKPENALYLLDGKEITQEKMQEMAPNQIKSVTVKKDAQALEKYGERAKGGVIEISTMESKPDTTFKPIGTAVSGNSFKKKSNGPEAKVTGEKSADSIVLKIKGKNNSGEPLYVVNGEKRKGLENVNTDKVTDVRVFKGKEAMERYGKEAENGVIIVNTDNKKEEIVVLAENSTIHSAGTRVAIKGFSGKNQPLYVIDGEELSAADENSKVTISKVSSDDIEEVTVLKGENAIEKYGEKGKNGVILITTKGNK